MHLLLADSLLSLCNLTLWPSQITFPIAYHCFFRSSCVFLGALGYGLNLMFSGGGVENFPSSICFKTSSILSTSEQKGKKVLIYNSFSITIIGSRYDLSLYGFSRSPLTDLACIPR